MLTSLQAINERIKELDFQDCKVRVSNVDSQESGKNIVVQVIGEISNKAAAHRKFVQAFVLAEQPKGYFVLNDIFRYIVDDEEEPENDQLANEEIQPAASAVPESTTLTGSGSAAELQHDVEQVDQKLENEINQKTADQDQDETKSSTVEKQIGTDALEVNHAEDAPVAAITETAEKAETPEQAAEAVAKEEDPIRPEKPRDPDPTPIASPAKPSKSTSVAPAEAAVPAAVAKPAAPKTWANLVAANRTAAPAIPNGASPAANSTSSAMQAKVAPSSTNRSASPSALTGEDSSMKSLPNGSAGWQMAGSDGNRKQGRQHATSSSISGNQEQVLGYVKNVTDKVDASILKSTLSQYGKLLYFDVSRPKVYRYPFPHFYLNQI